MDLNQVAEVPSYDADSEIDDAFGARCCKVKTRKLNIKDENIDPEKGQHI